MITVVGGPPWSDAQRGVELNEDALAINIRRFEVRYFPEINEKLPDNFGETIAKGISDKFSRDITFEGETLGAPVLALATALTFANDVDDLGDGSGLILLDEATNTQERAGWRSLNGRASSNPGLLTI
jgi:hypothetical protein